jgi:transcription elongation GreA/GreB family factor
LSLADFYYRHQRFGEAADLYRNLTANSDHPVIRKRYLLSLFYSGSHREALRVAQNERAGGAAIPLITAVEVTLLEEAGDIEEAKKLLAQLIAIEPDDPDHRIHLAHLRYRSGDTEGSKEAVLGVAPEEVKGSAHQLMALAKVRAWLDLDGVLELAYRARRVGFDDPEIHQAYMSLVLNRKRDQDSVLEISRVQPGSTIHLQDGEGNGKIFTIVEGLDADLHRGELLPSDPVALKLLGLGVGDSVYLKHTDLEVVTYRITKIESQYVFAFQETLLNFSTWFPEARGPEKMTVDPAGIDKVLQVINQRQVQAEATLELYKSKRITMGMLAQLSGNSAIQTWAGLQSGDDFRIMASSGDSQEIGLESALLLKAEILLLELTGLLTIACLDLLPALRRRFRQLIAPQFLLDEINDELTLERAGLRSGLRTAGTLYRRGDRYVWQEAPKSPPEDRIPFLEGLLEFLRHEVALRPTPEILEFRQRGTAGPLGRAALAAILLAKDCGALLYSDDFVLRGVARNTWGVAGVWSQSVIRDLARTSSISEDQHHQSVVRLAQRNYQFVSMNERDFIWVLRQDGMQVRSGFLRTLRALEGPDCMEDSAVIAVGSLLREVWLEAGPRTTRQLILDACVSTLKQGRHPFVVLSKLEALMQRIFVMHPEALSEILKTINLWKQEPDLMDQRLAAKRASRAKLQQRPA